jgi:hypothetical protein
MKSRGVSTAGHLIRSLKQEVSHPLPLMSLFTVPVVLGGGKLLGSSG